MDLQLVRQVLEQEAKQMVLQEHHLAGRRIHLVLGELRMHPALVGHRRHLVLGELAGQEELEPEHRMQQKDLQRLEGHQVEQLGCHTDLALVVPKVVLVAEGLLEGLRTGSE